jgi:DNA-binding MarR family transcriptional regulator
MQVVNHMTRKVNRDLRDPIATLRIVPPFSFLTNHGMTLLCIAEDPRVRMRDIAATVQITERAAQRIVADLIDAGYVDRVREGRRNAYTIRRDLLVALPDQRDVELGSLLNILVPADASTARREQVIAPH